MFDTHSSHRVSRRTWGQSVLGLSIAGMMARTAFAQEETPSSHRFKIGCSARSFHKLLPAAGRAGKMSVAEFIQKTGEWNCDCVELQDTSLTETDDKTLVALKREAVLSSVDLSAVSVYTDFIQPDPNKMQGEIERIQSWIRTTAKLGAPLLVVFPGSAKKNVSLDQSINHVAHALRTLAPYAQDHGVIIAIENHGMFVDHPEAVLAVAEKVDHPWVGINLDTGNFRSDYYENLLKLAPKAINCHLKLELGKGKKREPADLEKTFSILREAGYRGRVVLQYELAGDPLREVPPALARLQALAAG